MKGEFVIKNKNKKKKSSIFIYLSTVLSFLLNFMHSLCSFICDYLSILLVSGSTCADFKNLDGLKLLK